MHYVCIGVFYLLSINRDHNIVVVNKDIKDIKTKDALLYFNTL